MPVSLPLGDKPRQAPPPATTLRFPYHQPVELSNHADYRTLDLPKLFMTIRNPNDLTPLHTSALNIRMNRDTPLERLIPGIYLPPETWESDPAAFDDVNDFSRLTENARKLSNGTRVPGHQAYYVRMKELLCDNEDIYRVIERRPLDTRRSSVRIAHFRRFFQELHIVGEYWDTSLDAPSSHSTPDSLVVESMNNDTMNIDEVQSELQSTQSNEQSKTRTLRTVHINKSDPLPIITTSTAGNSSLLSPNYKRSSNGFSTASLRDSPPNVKSFTSTKDTYTGRRTSTGSAMPALHRHNLLKEFLEPILWAFGCRYDKPRTQPYLLLRNLKIPVDLSSVVYCTPEERPTTITGTLRGPLLGAQGRSETAFGEGGGQADVADLLREVGAMLLLAQQRAREGKEDVAPNADRWYVTKPRWGGGSGEAIGEALAPSPVEEVANAEHRYDDMTGRNEEPPMKKRSFERRLRGERAREAKKKEDWKKSVLPPASGWDKRVTYSRIGKDVASEFDDIYLVSSVNHHISLVRLRVHPQYLDYLANGGDPTGQPWFTLPMDRSRWFDLLVPEDRKAALRGVWGVVGWLMRA
ncbi:hypothetical protein MMC13_006539 [Lambiella insularis]|nr:hypothetical protein [Lambiella insularis]